MELAFKPDWEETKQRYLAWWKGELLDRCCVAVTAPKANPPAGDPPPYTGERGKHWFDFEWWAAWQDWAMARTFYGGEALPNWHAGYPGWAGIPTFLGCHTELDEVTGWSDPILNGGTLEDHDYRDLVITEDAPNWQLSHEMIRFGAEASRGKCVDDRRRLRRVRRHAGGPARLAAPAARLDGLPRLCARVRALPDAPVD